MQYDDARRFTVQAQVPINPYMLGQNAAFLPKGNPITNPPTNPTNLDNFYGDVKTSGVLSARIGGIALGFNPMYSFDANTLGITDAHSLIYVINKLLDQNIQPVIQVALEDPALCNPDLGPMAAKPLSDQATIAGNLVAYLINYYITNPHPYHGHFRPKYYIIGNEPDLASLCSGDGKGYNLDGSTNVTTDATTIATYMKDFSAKMKAKDPNIKIIGPELATWGTDADFWNPNKVMAKLISDPATNASTSVMGAINDVNNPANGKYFVDIVSFHTYPQGMTSDALLIANPTAIDGFKEKLVANNQTSNPKRTGLIKLITDAGRSVSNCKIACTEFNIEEGGGALDESVSGDWTTLVAGQTNRSYIAGQWMADMMSHAMEINSSNTPWVELMMPWSIKEGNCTEAGIFKTFGYISGCAAAGNRKRSTYHHYSLIANYIKGTFYRGTVSSITNPGNVKVFSGAGCHGVGIMIMNQENAAQNFDINFATTTPGGNNGKITLNNPSLSGWSNYNVSVGADETMVLVWDACRHLKRKITFNPTRYEADQGLLEVLYGGNKSCRCSKTVASNTPVFSLKCAVPTETGTVHYNSATLSSNTRFKDSAFVTGALIVPDGVTLTIDTAEVVFGGGASISVQSGGKLVITGSNLHACTDSTWKGIEVSGNNTASQFTLTTSQISDAIVAVKLNETNSPVITTNVFIEANQGIRMNKVTGFTISGNEFIDLPMGVSTSSCSAGTAVITENMFYQGDTAIKFSYDTHTTLDINCNAFVDYSRYGMYSQNSSLKNQGTADAGAGNLFYSASTLTNHQLYFTGSSSVTYYCEPSNAFTVTTDRTYLATVTTAGSDKECETISGRLAQYGIDPSKVGIASYNASRLVNCVPNPTSGKASISYKLADNTQAAEIKIMNLFGVTINTLKIEPGTTSVETNLSGLMDGIYFYSLTVNGTLIDSKKLIINK